MIDLKKVYSLHLDALLVLVLIFIISFGFNIYQKMQYSDLLQEFVDEKWKSADLQAQLDALNLSRKASASQEPNKPQVASQSEVESGIDTDKSAPGSE